MREAALPVLLRLPHRTAFPFRQWVEMKRTQMTRTISSGSSLNSGDPACRQSRLKDVTTALLLLCRCTTRSQPTWRMVSRRREHQRFRPTLLFSSVEVLVASHRLLLWVATVPHLTSLASVDEHDAHSLKHEPCSGLLQLDPPRRAPKHDQQQSSSNPSAPVSSAGHVKPPLTPSPCLRDPTRFLVP